MRIVGNLSGTNARSYQDFLNEIRKTTSKESAEKFDDILKSLDSLKELVERKDIRIQALLAHVLERENITQDRFDDIMNLLKSYGKQKGFKV